MNAGFGQQESNEQLFYRMKTAINNTQPNFNFEKIIDQNEALAIFNRMIQTGQYNTEIMDELSEQLQMGGLPFTMTNLLNKIIDGVNILRKNDQSNQDIQQVLTSNNNYLQSLKQHNDSNYLFINKVKIPQTFFDQNQKQGSIAVQFFDFDGNLTFQGDKKAFFLNRFDIYDLNEQYTVNDITNNCKISIHNERQIEIGYIEFKLCHINFKTATEDNNFSYSVNLYRFVSEVDNQTVNEMTSVALNLSINDVQNAKSQLLSEILAFEQDNEATQKNINELIQPFQQMSQGSNIKRSQVVNTFVNPKPNDTNQIRVSERYNSDRNQEKIQINFSNLKPEQNQSLKVSNNFITSSNVQNNNKVNLSQQSKQIDEEDNVKRAQKNQFIAAESNFDISRNFLNTDNLNNSNLPNRSLQQNQSFQQNQDQVKNQGFLQNQQQNYNQIPQQAQNFDLSVLSDRPTQNPFQPTPNNFELTPNTFDPTQSKAHANTNAHTDVDLHVLYLIYLGIGLFFGGKKSNMIDVCICIGFLSFLTMLDTTKEQNDKFKKYIVIAIGFVMFYDLIWMIFIGSHWLSKNQSDDQGSQSTQRTITFVVTLIMLLFKGFVCFSTHSTTNERMIHNKQLFQEFLTLKFLEKQKQPQQQSQHHQQEQYQEPYQDIYQQQQQQQQYDHQQQQQQQQYQQYQQRQPISYIYS